MFTLEQLDHPIILLLNFVNFFVEIRFRRPRLCNVSHLGHWDNNKLPPLLFLSGLSCRTGKEGGLTLKKGTKRNESQEGPLVGG